MDSYCGPLNRRAQAVFRTLSMKDFETTIAVVLSPDITKINEDSKQLMQKRLDLYSDFVKHLRKLDIPLVKALEDKLEAVSDAEIDKKCGHWLKLEASIDG